MKWRNKGHQFDAIGKHFAGKNIYIYGAGQTGKWVFHRLCFLNAVDAFIDANEEKQHRTMLDRPVLSPDILYKNYHCSHIVIVAIKDGKSAEAIMYRLLCAGYIRNYDFFLYSEFVPQESTENYKDSFYLRIYSVYAHNKIWLDSTAIYPSTLCNLKCKDCLALTPYIKNHRIKTLDECKDEVDAFFKWVDYVRWFQISGGEPQLWNKLPELLEYIGKRYRNRIGQRFEVVTNGSIMPSEKLMEVMLKYHMDMCIDDYGKLENCAKNIVNVLKMKGIDYIYDKPKWWFDLGCCDEVNSKFIHISSDCVYSGKAAGYVEMDVPDEHSYYGRTKYLGEVTSGVHLSLRTSIVGPELKENGIGLFNWFMHENTPVHGFAHVMWSGVTTFELARAVNAAVEQNLSGLYFLSNNEVISKYDLLCLFNKYCKNGTVEIIKSDLPISNKTLICTRNDFDYHVPGYEKMVKDMSEWIMHHKEIYGQYI